MMAISSRNHRPTPIISEPLSDAERADFTPALIDFTIDAFQRCFAESAESGATNTMVSPLSMMLALAMTANGAAEGTLAEMEAVLGRGIPLGDLNRMLAAYVSNLPSEEGSKLNIANSIWFREGFEVVNEFLRINEEFYAAEIAERPFNESTLDEINAWVDENTDGMIDHILDEIDPLAVMFLINAIVFDADWAVSYVESRVRPHDFTTADGRIQEAEMMWSDEQIFLRGEGAAGFLKPYSGGDYSFAAILPDEGVSIEDFIAGMSVESFSALMSSAHRPADGVVAALPKFSFEYEIKLNDVLEDMGMPTAFSGEADFSRLSANEDDPVGISSVRHKTFIDVDEVGTRAAAVTIVEVGVVSVTQPEFVILERPFVFAIIDNATHLPIFIGALTEIPS
jgi:serpin B